MSTTFAPQPITYAAFNAGVDRMSGRGIAGLHSDAGGVFIVEAVLEDGTFIARGERTGARVLARIGRVYPDSVRVQFRGLVDNGRDSEGVMLDPSGTKWNGSAFKSELARAGIVAGR